MISVNIDLDDILWSMTKNEKQELVDELYKDGFIAKEYGPHPDDVEDTDWDIQIRKLIGNKWRISKEDEETILRITNKLI